CRPSRAPISAVCGSLSPAFRGRTFASYERMRQRAEAIEAECRVAGGVRAAGENPDRIARCGRPRHPDEAVLRVVSIVTVAGGTGNDRGHALGILARGELHPELEFVHFVKPVELAAAQVQPVLAVAAGQLPGGQPEHVGPDRAVVRDEVA